MSKFILLYKGPATPSDMMSEETRNKVMEGWKNWMEALGPALLDMGTPLGDGRSIVDDGSVGEALDLSGYTIIEAENMDGAVQMVQGHPFLSDKTGEFSVEVFELMNAPGM